MLTERNEEDNYKFRLIRLRFAVRRSNKPQSGARTSMEYRVLVLSFRNYERDIFEVA